MSDEVALCSTSPAWCIVPVSSSRWTRVIAAADRLAVDRELEMSVERQRQVVLRDLVALGQVRVEVVLAVELGEGGDVAVQRERGAHREVHGLLR